MAALTDNRDTPELLGDDLVADLTILNDEVIYGGAMIAIDSSLESQAAADTAGLRVVGRAPKKVDNADDGSTDNVERGIFRYAVSSTFPITRAGIGTVCYVEDDQTVAGSSTNLIAAGLVHDVDSSGVWVDQTAAALATARRLARPKVLAKTDDYTITAAQAFQGNIVFTGSKATTGNTFTLPAAASGYRVGIQRLTATAGYDVVVTAGTGDTVRGSAAAGTITNDTDAVSDVLWLETADATAWLDAMPLAKDLAEWTPST